MRNQFAHTARAEDVDASGNTKARVSIIAGVFVGLGGRGATRMSDVWGHYGCARTDVWRKIST